MPTSAMDTADLLKSPHPLESPRPFAGGGGGGGGFTPGHTSVSGGGSVRGGDQGGGFNRGLFFGTLAGVVHTLFFYF